MTLLEFPPLPNTTLPAASDVIKLQADCYRAIDAMNARSGPSRPGHVVTTLGPQTLEETLPRNLKAIEGLPPLVQAFLKKPEGSTVELAGLLEQAASSDQDPGELSWSALGHLIRETQFVHVYRRLVFMKMIWNVPVDEFWGRGARLGGRASPGAIPPGTCNVPHARSVTACAGARSVQYIDHSSRRAASCSA